MKTRQIHGLGLGEFLIFAPAKEMLKSAYFFSALVLQRDFFSVLAITAVRFFVRPWGVEPQSSEPESDILSIELRAHFSDLRWQKYKINVSFAKRFMQNL